jgi:hypothetical protein
MACSYRRIASRARPSRRAISADTSVLVGECRWIVFGPLAQLFPVRRQEVAPRLLLVGGSLLIERRHRQRGVVEVVERLDLEARRREAASPCRLPREPRRSRLTGTAPSV